MKHVNKGLWTLLAFLVMFGVAEMSHAYCQPQCVTHARDESGINSCQVGPNGTALDWYNCEKSHGKTTNKPKKKRVIILKSNQHGIGHAGHAMYIYKKKSKGSGKYSLRLSHTNFDGRCGGPEKCKAKYYRYKKKLKIKTGVWAGRKYKVMGIIKK